MEASKWAGGLWEIIVVERLGGLGSDDSNFPLGNGVAILEAASGMEEEVIVSPFPTIPPAARLLKLDRLGPAPKSSPVPQRS